MNTKYNPMISVIVPVYNVENYVSKCLASIVAQTYDNLEIIVINDGSKDSSGEICKQYLTDKRVEYIENDNMGLGLTRQLGFDKARGEYICSIDSDDYIAENMIEEMYNLISETGSDMCVCGRIDFDGSQSLSYPLNSKIDIICADNNFCGLGYFMTTNYSCASETWNKLYKKSFIQSSCVRFEMPKELNGTDSLYNYSLILHKPKICMLHEELYYHRIVKGSRVHRKGKKLLQTASVCLKKLLDENEKACDGDKTNKIEITKLFYALVKNALVDVYIENKKSIQNFVDEYKQLMDCRASTDKPSKKNCLNPELIKALNRENIIFIQILLNLDIVKSRIKHIIRKLYFK